MIPKPLPVVLNIQHPSRDCKLIMDYNREHDKYYVYQIMLVTENHQQEDNLRVYDNYDEALREMNRRCEEYNMDLS